MPLWQILHWWAIRGDRHMAESRSEMWKGQACTFSFLKNTQMQNSLGIPTIMGASQKLLSVGSREELMRYLSAYTAKMAVEWLNIVSKTI
jgi:hypothetical protein